jgi:hypothetical protein
MVQSDGDPAPSAQKVEIIVKPRALNVLMPRHALHLLQNHSSRQL